MSASSAPVSSRGAARSATLIAPGKSFRQIFESHRGPGGALSLEHAIIAIVPLCLELKTRHERGEKLYVHASCIVARSDGAATIDTSKAVVPTNARDRACTAPELHATLSPGDARASVFAIGAILYEAVTGSVVGPAMQRPRSLVPSLPDSFETLIAKALVSDPSHRPDDLGALASAMHHLAPTKSIAPPSADESKLDHTGEFDVDIRLSMLPMEDTSGGPVPPSIDLTDPFSARALAPAATPSSGRVDPTAQLGALKARLESDTRARYVVNKDKMDHGPFTAVELLQQITSNQFTHKDILRDELSGQSRAIGEWEEFSPFAKQADIRREIVAEKKAVAEVEKSDTRRGIAKTTIGLAVLALLIGGAAIWFFKVRGSRNDDVDVADDPNASDIELNGGVKGTKHGGGRGHGGGGGAGFPSGMSYEQALNSNNQEVTIGAGNGGPDLTDSQLSGPLKNGGFISGCGAPESMKVEVRVAIKLGRAIGVTVVTNPPNQGVTSCIDHAVRGMGWPSSPKMDSFKTNY
ncbi:MAG: hypothetical protein ACRELY_30030 [Polyangiaceae bacterium]